MTQRLKWVAGQQQRGKESEHYQVFKKKKRHFKRNVANRLFWKMPRPVSKQRILHSATTSDSNKRRQRKILSFSYYSAATKIPKSSDKYLGEKLKARISKEFCYNNERSLAQSCFQISVQGLFGCQQEHDESLSS